jgi:peptidoglycan hydrolase-like protein with peptidoglycan-binding domain
MTDEKLDPAEGDFSVQESEIAPAPKKAAASKRNPASKKVHVVGGGDVDNVEVSRLTADTSRRKSLSVHHLQRRLAELGFNDAAASVDGRYDSLTVAAVIAWQEKNGFDSGPLTLEQTQAIFDNDPNVQVLP